MAAKRMVCLLHHNQVVVVKVSAVVIGVEAALDLNLRGPWA